jgi:hypothetical protein
MEACRVDSLADSKYFMDRWPATPENAGILYIIQPRIVSLKQTAEERNAPHIKDASWRRDAIPEISANERSGTLNQVWRASMR